MIETDAALRELRSQKKKAMSQFVADNENKLADAARKADERAAIARQGGGAARAHEALLRRSTASCSRLAVTTVGQVVTTGQQLIVMTPSSGALQVDALVGQSRHWLRQDRPARGDQGRRVPVHAIWSRCTARSCKHRRGGDRRAGGETLARQRHRLGQQRQRTRGQRAGTARKLSSSPSRSRWTRTR